MGDFFRLQYSFCETIQPKVDEEQADGGDHCHQPEIPRRQQSSKDYGSNHLDCQAKATRKYSYSGTADGEPTDFALAQARSKNAMFVKQFQWRLASNFECYFYLLEKQWI